MNRRIVHLLVALAFVLGSAQSGLAVPVTWSLLGAVFSDASTASGGFTFDANTGLYSNVFITTSAGPTIYTTNELNAIPFGTDQNGISLVDNFVPNNNAGKPILNFDFQAPLTNAGGSVLLVVNFPSFEGTCGAADCSSGGITRVVTAGRVVTPEPATLALVGVGLAALVFLRRKSED